MDTLNPDDCFRRLINLLNKWNLFKASESRTGPDAEFDELETLAIEIHTEATPLLGQLTGGDNLLADLETRSITDCLLQEVPILGGTIRKHTWMCAEVFRTLPSSISDPSKRLSLEDICSWLCSQVFRRFCSVEDRPSLTSTEDLFHVASHLFSVMLQTELFRRQSKNENPDGKVIRQLLVNKDDPQEAATSLQAALRLVLWNTHNLSDSDGKEEKQAVGMLALVTQLQEFMSVPPIALTPPGLAAIAEGHFNRTMWQARDKLRTEMKKRVLHQLRFDRKDQSFESPAPDEARQQSWPEEYEQAFLRKLVQTLTRQQRMFLEIRLDSETQAEAAARMKVSPSAASQLQSAIRRKIQALFERERESFANVSKEFLRVP